MAHQYILRVTAGSSYDLSKHTEVPVNTADPVRISSPLADVELNVRIQNYGGLPRKSPNSSPYFTTEPHATNKDQYSIAMRFTPKRPGGKQQGEAAKGQSSSEGSGISGHDLQFGNDFDHPIRDRLPPGFGTAMNIVKWWIDPGLEGDVYADEPHLYGPALSSFNAVHVGGGAFDAERGGLWVEEGGDEDGLGRREAVGAPSGQKERMKWALKDDSKERWVWEYGRTYALDFYNAYLNFNDFSLRLPGFTLPIMRYWDGQGLRYVLRNRATGDVYLVVFFTLYLKEDVNEDGTLKPAALEATAKQQPKEQDGEGNPAHAEAANAPAHEHADFDEKKAMEEARRHYGARHGEDEELGPVETSPDDVD